MHTQFVCNNMKWNTISVIISIIVKNQLNMNNEIYTMIDTFILKIRKKMFSII